MRRTIALVTDTHVRVAHDDGQRAFPSDQDHNARNRRTAEAIRQMHPDLVIHLGDVVHPIPSLPTHREALQMAAEIYGDLGAEMVVVPGNHDVGDKHTTANAPAQAEIGRQAFRAAWGAPFRSLDLDALHLVTIDGTLLDARTDEAATQRRWLEDDLRDADGRRIFVFTHYPPFLCDPDEDEHYDNLGPEPRRWLLDLLDRHRVEAVFSGHVHRFFYNRYRGIDLYTLPGAAFTRPEYAALRPTPPTDAENGRDDREHLGVTRLVVTDTDHRISVVRPSAVSPQPAAVPLPLGVWLSHPLGERTTLPLGDLDALHRKVARNDAVLLQLVDLGISWIRIPLSDRGDPDVAARLAWLQRHGVSVGVFSSGLPTADQAIQASGAPWEVVTGPGQVEALASRLEAWGGPPVILGRIGRSIGGASAPYFSHFPRQGYDPSDPALDRLMQAAAPRSVSGIAFRVADGAPIVPQIASAVARAEDLGTTATCHVELPFGSEAVPHTDDAVTAARCVEALDAARAHPSARIALDLWVDKDRGYWCRHGLLDVEDRPRLAYLALKGPR